MKIKKKKVINYKGIVCDLHISNSHTYNVECIGVHNSCAGSLVAYLIGITQINPVLYNLSFARFYNHSRNVPDNISFAECPYDGFGV